MTLLELLKDLTYGELSSLKIGELIPGEYESEPDPTRYEQLMSHINLGLKEIYKRFYLLSRDMTIEIHSEISLYMLHSKYAYTSTSDEDPKYIIDTVASPFKDDLLKIEEILDEDDEKLTLNDFSDDDTILTPSYRTFIVPTPIDDIFYTVKYRASHPRLVWTSAIDPSTIDIALPDSLHEAILYYVASRAYAGMGGDGGIEGNDYFQRFENSCQTVKETGLHIQTEPGAWRFDDYGWV